MASPTSQHSGWNVRSIAFEAAALSEHAFASGATLLGACLNNLSTCAKASPAAAIVALRDLTELMGLPIARAGAMSGHSGGTVVMDHGRGGAEGALGGIPPGVSPGRGREPVGIVEPSHLVPPPLMMSRIGIEGAPPEFAVRASTPDPIAPIPGKPPGIVSRAPALAAVPCPEPGRPPTPPKLLAGTFLGFRAFGRRPAATPIEELHSNSPPAPAGLLGLGNRRKPFSTRPRSDSGPPLNPVGIFDRPKRVEAGRPVGDYRRVKSAPTAKIPIWFYAVVAAFVPLTAIIVAVLTGGGRGMSRPAGETSTATSTVGPTPSLTSTRPASTPITSATSGNDGLASIHPRGVETAQMRSLIETQNRMMQACRNDPGACGRGWIPLTRDALNPIDMSTVFLIPPPDEPVPAWLRTLKLPEDFPIHDEPALRNLFDYGTKNIAGRQGFQAKLFQCSAYADIFESTLLKYGAPRWLQAVVYQESGCNPTARSPCGARGMWQFMEESARAYGLRVVDGEVDERLNPVKSTDAAIHFLTDLQRMLGGWDLALAAYNMGPYGVLARLNHVGDKVGFWELAHAHLLPDETAGYVPAIEAYALMLKNVSRLQFNPYGKRLESTAEVVVRPGTRLSLLARASSTTTAHIRDLNPEFLRDVVPDGESTARIPDSEAHRAQSFLEAWSPADNRDTCVPEDFDWGAQQFESSRFAKNCQAFKNEP